MKYMREIGHVDGAVEEIGERFDNALDLMTPNSVVYGGAIRDIMAGMPLKGDLDIAVSPIESSELISNFKNSSKWIDPKINIGPADIIKCGHRGGGSDDSSRAVRVQWTEPQPGGGGIRIPGQMSSGSPYEDLAPIERVSTFVSIGGIRVQVIVSSDHGDPLESALEIVRNVDIICCGLCMMQDGRVFEIVSGAEQDCAKKILRINYDSCNITDVERSVRRLKHIQDLGWKQSVNMKALGRKVTKTLAELERNRKAKAAADDLPIWKREKLCRLKGDLPYIIISSVTVNKIGNASVVASNIKSFLNSEDIPSNVRISNSDGQLQIEIPSSRKDECLDKLNDWLWMEIPIKHTLQKGGYVKTNPFELRGKMPTTGRIAPPEGAMLKARARKMGSSMGHIVGQKRMMSALTSIVMHKIKTTGVFTISRDVILAEFPDLSGERHRMRAMRKLIQDAAEAGSGGYNIHENADFSLRVLTTKSGSMELLRRILDALSAPHTKHECIQAALTEGNNEAIPLPISEDDEVEVSEEIVGITASKNLWGPVHDSVTSKVQIDLELIGIEDQGAVNDVSLVSNGQGIEAHVSLNDGTTKKVKLSDVQINTLAHNMFGTVHNDVVIDIESSTGHSMASSTVNSKVASNTN